MADHCITSGNQTGLSRTWALAAPDHAALPLSTLRPPEGLIRLAKRFFLRDADVLQEMKVVAFGDLAQCAALARTGDPAGDRAAAARDPGGGDAVSAAVNGLVAELPATDQNRHEGLRCVDAR
jgi:hypothetical protein